MSEIEKMYKLAQIANEGYDAWDMKDIYPPFTAEKQVEIIKFLIGKHAQFDKLKNYKQQDVYAIYYECRYFPKQHLPFGEALAESINYLWQDLTKEEKQQVKGILE